jgi:hypothetical protein
VDVLSMVQRIVDVNFVRRFNLTPGAAGRVLRGGAPTFVPTGAVGLFQTLRARLPRHQLLATGFDELPPSSARGLGPELRGCSNAPLVSHATRGDLATYLLLPRTEVGQTDIFFASDFNLLLRAYEGTMATGVSRVASGSGKNNDNDNDDQAAAVAARVMPRRTLGLRAAEFVALYVDVPKMALVNSLYNPVVEDFKNVQFLLSDPHERTRRV